jgi:hypothetical protein
LKGNMEVWKAWRINNLPILPYTILFKILRKIGQIL